MPPQHLVKQHWDLPMLKLGGNNYCNGNRDEFAFVDDVGLSRATENLEIHAPDSKTLQPMPHFTVNSLN